MQPKQQQKRAEKQTVSNLKEEQIQPALNKKRSQKQAVMVPTQNPTPTAVNPAPPSAPVLPPAHLHSPPLCNALLLCNPPTTNL